MFPLSVIYIANIFLRLSSFDLIVGISGLFFFFLGRCFVVGLLLMCFHIYAVSCVKLFFGGLWNYEPWLGKLAPLERLVIKNLSVCSIVKSQLVHEKGKDQGKPGLHGRHRVSEDGDPDIAHSAFFSPAPLQADLGGCGFSTAQTSPWLS